MAVGCCRLQNSAVSCHCAVSCILPSRFLAAHSSSPFSFVNASGAMQSIWATIALLCSFTAFISPPYGVSGSMNASLFRRLYPRHIYYHSLTYTAVRYTKARSSYMNSMKMYNRAYTNSYNFGEAALYHRAYSYAVRLYGHYTHLYFTGPTRTTKKICGNFETNPYGDFIGFFICPLFFEPSNFTYCCGKKKSHFCCSDSSRSNPYTMDPRLGKEENEETTNLPLILGLVFVFLFLIGFFSLFSYQAYRYAKSRQEVLRNATFVAVGPGVGQPWTVSSGVAPVPYPQQPVAMYPPPTSGDAAQPPTNAGDPSAAPPPPSYATVSAAGVPPSQ